MNQIRASITVTFCCPGSIIRRSSARTITKKKAYLVASGMWCWTPYSRLDLVAKTPQRRGIAYRRHWYCSHHHCIEVDAMEEFMLLHIIGVFSTEPFIWLARHQKDNQHGRVLWNDHRDAKGC